MDGHHRKSRSSCWNWVVLEGVTLEVTIPEIQRVLNCPGPSKIMGKNSQKKGNPCPNPDLDERTSGLLCMRNSPEGGSLALDAIMVLGRGGNPNSFQNFPRFHQAEEEQGISRGDPGLGAGCDLGERHSSFLSLALVPALFICSGVSTEPENSTLFIGTNQEILLLEFPFG